MQKTSSPVTQNRLLGRIVLKLAVRYVEHVSVICMNPMINNLERKAMSFKQGEVVVLKSGGPDNDH